MKAILISLILFAFFSLSSLGQKGDPKDQEVKDHPNLINALKLATDCSVTWCGECDGELSIYCNEVLKLENAETSSLKFNVTAKRMPQDEVAFFYRQTENTKFGEAIILRIQKELKAGDILVFNRISYRNQAGELVKSDDGFSVVLK